MTLRLLDSGDVREYEGRTGDPQLFAQNWALGKSALMTHGGIRRMTQECVAMGALLDRQRGMQRVCSDERLGRILKISLAGKCEDDGMRRKIFPYLLVMVAASGVLAGAARRQEQDQSQTDSVAEAARKARDKKKAATKSPKVITDDDLNRSRFQPGQEGLNVGAPPKLETEPPSTAAVANAEAADQSTEKVAEDDAEMARLKLQLAQAQKDLDLAQRELALDQDAYFSKPDYASDTAGKAKLDNEKQQISDMQQEVEKLKTRLAALEELKGHRKGAQRQAAPPAQDEKPAAPPQQ
jgi:hypothetical protein